MIKYLTGIEQRKFWEIHTKAKEKLKEYWRNLPFIKKVAITERLQIDCALLQGTMGNFGLGELSDDACNRL